MTTPWTADHVSRIDPHTVSTLPILTAADRSGLRDDILYWDMWPIQQTDGRIAQIKGREYWMALAAPDRGDPGLRHFEAKIRLLERRNSCWQDHGPVLPDFVVPYEREWAGSALVNGDTVSLFFTGAGVCDRPNGYQQALYEAHGTLSADGLPILWGAPRPSLTHVTPDYMPADAH